MAIRKKIPLIEDTANLAVSGDVSIVGGNSAIITFPTITSTLETTVGSQAKADAKVADAINDGMTTIAPSQNAVFDALALKADKNNPVFTGTISASNLSGTNTGDQDLSTLAPKDSPVFLGNVTLSNRTIIKNIAGTKQFELLNGYGNDTDGIFSIYDRTNSAPRLNIAATGEVSCVLSSTVTATTQSANDNSTKIATTAYVDSKIIVPTKRVVTTTDDATAVIDWDVTDTYELSAVANATTFTLTGTPTDSQKIMIRFKDAGVAKALTWTGFTVVGVTLPTTTVAGKWHYVGIEYNSAASQTHVIAVGVQA